MRDFPFAPSALASYFLTRLARRVFLQEPLSVDSGGGARIAAALCFECPGSHKQPYVLNSTSCLVHVPYETTVNSVDSGAAYVICSYPHVAAHGSFYVERDQMLHSLVGEPLNLKILHL